MTRTGHLQDRFITLWVSGVVYKNNLSVIHGPFFILFGSKNNYFDTNIAYDKDWEFTR